METLFLQHLYKQVVLANPKNLLLTTFILVNLVGFSQTTPIPDPKFEQALIDLGYDSGDIDGVILTADISVITSLDVSNKKIINLSGIEDFVALTNLNCNNNKLMKYRCFCKYSFNSFRL